MHGAEVARALAASAPCCRVRRAFCALGMLQSDVRQDYMHVFLADLDAVDRAGLEAGFAELEARAREALGREGFANGSAALSREVDLRYDGQQWPVRVALRDLRCCRGAATTRPSISGCSATSSRAESSASPRCALVAACLTGRPRLLPQVGRSSRANSARSGSIPSMAGATCLFTTVPISGRAANSTARCTSRAAVYHRFVGPRDRLEVDPRDDFLVHVDVGMTELDPVTLALVQTGSTTSRTRWAG